MYFPDSKFCILTDISLKHILKSQTGINGSSNGTKHATNLYLTQWWPESTTPYGVSRPQRVECGLTHWGRVTYICVGKLTIIGSENGLSPSRRQAIIWTNAGLLSIGTLQTYFSEILIKIQQFSLKKIHLKMSSAKRRLCCLGPNVFIAFVTER